MSGETDLATMLKTLDPVLDPRRFVFASYPNMTLSEAAKYEPLGAFHEPEGLTLIVEETAVEIGTEAPRFAMISLRVHSSLEAVGLTAAISKVLTEQRISANVVAAAFHDHIFVPIDRSNDALEALRSLRGA